jgi:hypothetical protein
MFSKLHIFRAPYLTKRGTGTFIGIYIFSFLLICFVSFGTANAAPRYNPGETLDPDCLPTDPDCTVSNPPSAWSTTTSSVSGQLTNSPSNNSDVVTIGSNSTTTAKVWFDPNKQMSYFSGNVGIGTVSPSQKLDVTGSVNISAGSAYMYSGSKVIIASPTINNYFFGNAGNLTMTGIGGNTAQGFNSLSSNIDGFYNTANGMSSLRRNTSGSSNTAIGVSSLFYNTSGLGNTASGMSSLYSNTSGSYNTTNGVNSLQFNTTGFYNTASGASSLYSNTEGSNNASYGANSMNTNTTGNFNTAMGFEALRYNSSATSSTAIGYQAGKGVSGTANQNNSLFGYQSGLGLSTGSNNTLLGYSSGSNLTTGSNNILLGYNVQAPVVNSTNFLNIGNTIYGNTGTGNVGLGTTSPMSLFAIEGDRPALTISNTYLNKSFWELSTGKAVFADTGFDITDVRKGLTRLHITQEGQVMVGTTSNPALGNASKMFIWGGLNGANVDAMGDASQSGGMGDQATFEAEGADYGISGNINSIAIRYKGLNPTHYSFAGISTSNLGVLDFGTSNGAVIRTATNTPIVFGINDSEIMRLTANGLGIGTSTPGSILSLGNTGSNTINFSTTATSTFGTGIDLRSGCFSVNGVCIGGGSSSGLSALAGAALAKGNFLVGNDAGVSQATSTIFLASNGNVGIGTTTPAYLLTLGGTDTAAGTLSIGTASTNYNGVVGNNAILIHANQTNPLSNSGAHAVRDESTYSVSSGTGGYASFDANAQMIGTIAYNHLAGFQSRQLYGGSGVLDTLNDFDAYPTVNGPVSTRNALSIYDALGTGAITQQNGILIQPMTRGTTNYAINQQGATNINLFNGLVQMNNNLFLSKAVTNPHDSMVAFMDRPKLFYDR